MFSRHRIFATLLGVACLFYVSAGYNVANDPKPALKTTPESIEDLRALEKKVQAVVAKVTPSVVGLLLGPAQGSGVIIKDGYILTAGHVSGVPNRKCIVVTPDGKKLDGKTLGRNTSIDSGLVQITTAGDYPPAEMGRSTGLRKGQWVVTIGHPGGFRPNRTPVVRVGRILHVDGNVIQTDCTLVGGDSGGPLFDLDGKVIGIHSRIMNKISENFHVPVDTYINTWDRLAKGEQWGGPLGIQPLVQSRGGKIVFEKSDKLTADEPVDKLFPNSFYKVYDFKMSPGSDYTIDLVDEAKKKFKRGVDPFDPYLRLEDSTGKKIADDDDSGGNQSARIVFRPTKEDNYKIIATSLPPGKTGSFKLIVRQLDLKEQMVIGKVDVLQAFRMHKPVAGILVDKLRRLGQPIFASGTLFDGQGKLAPSKEIAFQWKNVKNTFKSDDQGVIRLALSKDNVHELFLDVPKDLKVLLELTDGAGNLVPLKFSADEFKEKVRGDGGMIVLDTKGTLARTDTVDKVRRGCFHQSHMFKATGGATYTFDLQSNEFDAFLRLEDSSGKKLAEDDDGAGDLNSRIVYSPGKDENIRIVVTTCDPGEHGAYRLTVRQAEAKKTEEKK
jgi:hypothetical protein